jgi:hypothetical protein
MLKPKPTIDREPTQIELDNIDKVEKMLATEDTKSLPNSVQIARNLAKDSWRSLKAFLRGDKVLTTSDEALRRWDICKECPFLLYDETNPDTGKRDGRCVQCACFMNVKVHFQQCKCPVDKWQ